MDKKIIFGILILGVLIISFVSAGLFNVGNKITGNAIAEGWTDWYDKDSPSGDGDFELVSQINPCVGEPTQIECQTIKGIDYSETEEIVTCDAEKGFYCRNADNGGGNWLTGYRCDDYKVRFYCGEVLKSGVCLDPNNCEISEGTKVGIPEGYLMEIAYMDANSVKLKISSEDGTITELSPSVRELETFTFFKDGDGYYLKVDVKDILYSTKENSIGKVVISVESIEEETSYCSQGVCHLYEGDEVISEGSSFKIEYISSTSVKLSVNGEIIDTLNDESFYQIKDGRTIIVKDILFSSKDSEKSKVVFTISVNTPTPTEEVTYQGVLDMFRIGSYGGCDSVETPWDENWDSSDDDYQEDVLPFIEADINGDTVTTGAEYCSSVGLTCLFGFRSGSDGAIRDLIGCCGGDSHEVYRIGEGGRSQYLCCSPI